MNAKCTPEGLMQVYNDASHRILTTVMDHNDQNDSKVLAFRIDEYVTDITISHSKDIPNLIKRKAIKYADKVLSKKRDKINDMESFRKEYIKCVSTKEESDVRDSLIGILGQIHVRSAVNSFAYMSDFPRPTNITQYTKLVSLACGADIVYVGATKLINGSNPLHRSHLTAQEGIGIVESASKMYNDVTGSRKQVCLILAHTNSDSAAGAITYELERNKLESGQPNQFEAYMCDATGMGGKRPNRAIMDMHNAFQWMSHEAQRLRGQGIDLHVALNKQSYECNNKLTALL